MPFSNPIVGGTALVRQAINSPNYVAGSAGWAIKRDGTAEFSNATIRGEVDVGAPSPGTRTVITKNLPPPLNTYVFSLPFAGAGVVADEAILFYEGDGTNTNFNFIAHVTNATPTLSGFVAGSVFAGSVVEDGVSGQAAGLAVLYNSSGSPIVQYFGPQMVGPHVTAPSFTADFLSVQDAPLALNIAGFPIVKGGKNDLSIDGLSAGRGTVLFVASTANVGPFGVKTTVLADPGVKTYRNGRTYKVTFGGVFASTVAGSTATIELDNGATLVSGLSRLSGFQLAGAGQDEHKWITYFANTSGNDVTTGLNIKMTPNAGNLTALHNAAYPFTLQIEDMTDSVAAAGLPSL